MGLHNSPEDQQAAQFFIEAGVGSVLLVAGMRFAENVVSKGLNAISSYRERNKPPQGQSHEVSNAFWNETIDECIEDVRRRAGGFIRDEDFRLVQPRTVAEKRIAEYERMRDIFVHAEQSNPNESS